VIIMWSSCGSKFCSCVARCVILTLHRPVLEPIVKPKHAEAIVLGEVLGTIKGKIKVFRNKSCRYVEGWNVVLLFFNLTFGASYDDRAVGNTRRPQFMHQEIFGTYFCYRLCGPQTNKCAQKEWVTRKFPRTLSGIETGTSTWNYNDNLYENNLLNHCLYVTLTLTEC